MASTPTPLDELFARFKEHLLRADRLLTLGPLAGGGGHELNNITAVFKSPHHFIRMNSDRGVPPDPEELERRDRVPGHP